MLPRPPGPFREGGRDGARAPEGVNSDGQEDVGSPGTRVTTSATVASLRRSMEVTGFQV